jgi:neutral ceramidase
MGDTGVRRSIVQQLSTQYPGIYTDQNIAFVATHSHAGVGGYVENLLPQITSLGYVKQTADAIVEGTVRAVQRAHASLAPGKLSFGNTTLVDGNINRSPTAYLANPAAERAKYQYDTDKDMTLLRFDDQSGKARGFLSFYPVHGTSLYIVSAPMSWSKCPTQTLHFRTTPWLVETTREWPRSCTRTW